MNINNMLIAFFAYFWMQVNFGRRLAAFGATEIEEIITKRWIKCTITNILFHYFMFIYFGMFGVVVGYVLYSLHVCVWARQIRQLCLTIPLVVLFVLCASGAFLGGSQGGKGMPPPPPVYVQCSALGVSPGQRPKICYWAVFTIFSGFCYF
jgi:hypothetical protein